MVAEKTEKPVCLKRKIDLKTLQMAQPFLQYREYDIIAEVSLGIALPSEDDYSVKICVADYVMQTKNKPELKKKK